MAVTLVLDTSVYSAFFRGDSPNLRQYFTVHSRFLMPNIVLGELRAGFAAGSKQAFNQQNLEKFLSSPNVDTVTITDQTTQHYASLFASLKSAGTPISTNDLWIAAICLEHNAALLTLDGDFKCVPGIKLAKL